MQAHLSSYDAHKVRQIERDVSAYADVCRAGGSHKDGRSKLESLGACTLHCLGFQKYDISTPVALSAPCAMYVREAAPGLLALVHTGPARHSLRDLGDHLTLLSVLARNACWRDCLSDSNSSYGLTQCLLNAINLYHGDLCGSAIKQMRGFRELATLTEAVMPDLLTILNDWLAPDEPWVDLPTVQGVSEALFGMAWWDFSATNPDTVALMIKSESPEFVAGRVLWNNVDMCLPESFST
jgi:hypothetical protein